MNFNSLLVSIPAALFILANAVANAGQTINEAGTMACVNDKWDEKEQEKGHKLVDFASRCIEISDEPAAQKYIDDCVGKYEYMPDESWKGSGTCTQSSKGWGGDKVFLTWEEGSHLKEFVYKFTGGTGKYEGAKGGATYMLDELTSTLYGGRYKKKMELP